MQEIFLIRQDDRKPLRMKSTAKQENKFNFKRNIYIPKMCVNLCPVGSTTSGGDAGQYLVGKYGEGQIKNDEKASKVVTFSKLTAL